jgi:hypothetical protein
MNKTLLKEINEQYEVPKYHGMETADTLKFLSEMSCLPEPIRNDYYKQYAEHLSSIGECDNWELGKQIFNHFNGNDDVSIIEEICSHTWNNVTFKALKINIPYFTRVKNYKASLGEIRRIDDNPVILDIVIDGTSLFDNFKQKPINDSLSNLIDKFFLVNTRDYAILEKFTKPYNGIKPVNIVNTFKEMTEKRAYGNFHNETTILSYIKGVYNGFNYFTHSEVDIKNYKEIFIK